MAGGALRQVATYIAPTFTPEWSNFKISAGGCLTGIKANPNGSIVTKGDTYGAFKYVTAGSVTQAGTTFGVPAWRNLITSDSIGSTEASYTNGYSLNVAAVDIAFAPNNDSIGLVWIWNKMYVTTDGGSNFTPLMGGFTTELTFNPNGQAGVFGDSWVKIDPNNSSIGYCATPSNGVWRNTNITGGGSWSKISGIPNGTVGGSIYFDPTNSTRVVIFSKGTSGHYESSNSGASFGSVITTGTPPSQFYHGFIDSFGQIWGVEAFSGTAGAVYKYASSTWTRYTAATGGNNQLTAVLQDPNSASSGANRIIAITWQGWIWTTLDGGTNWVEIGSSNISMSAPSPQAPWLDLIDQYFGGPGGNVQLNVINATILPSGKIYAATGIDCWTTPCPTAGGVRATTAVWTSDNVGIDQLVNNLIISTPGMAPLMVDWDRALIRSKNPDEFPDNVYPNKNTNEGWDIISHGWGADYAKFSTNSTLTIYGLVSSSATAGVVKSTDGGFTWALTVGQPSVGCSKGGIVAVSGTSSACCIPGNDSGGYDKVFYTSNGGTSWTQSSFTGSPTNFIDLNSGYQNNRQILVADSTTANKYYVMDRNRKVFVSTDGGANFSAAGATTSDFNSFGQQDRMLVPPPNSFGTANHVFYAPQAGNIYKSTNGMGAGPTKLNTNMDNVVAFGFGAPLPGGSGYPTIYAYQGSGTLAQGIYQSTDGGTTWTLCQIPAGKMKWPYGILDYPQWISGDVDVYGRIYFGVKGFTATYIDTSDACPWVKMWNVVPLQALTGSSVTLTARKSGRAPIATNGVRFVLDIATTATQIGNPLTGDGPYSVSFNASAQTPGAHTISVISTGANGSSTATIPITTS